MKLPIILSLATLLGLAATLAAIESPNFSGSYTLVRTEGGAFQVKKGSVWALEIFQTETAIEVTKVRNGHRYVYRFPLDGTEGVCNEPNGVRSKCEGHFKGKYLLLDSVLTVRVKGYGSAIESHTKERWELSADLKTLKIQTDVETTNADTQQVIGNNIGSWSEIYNRN